MRALAFILALGCASVAQAQESTPEETPMQRVERILAIHMDRVVESESFQAETEGMDPAQASSVGRRLASQGVTKLSDRDLVRRVHILNQAIVGADEPLCAAQLLGGTQEQSQLVLGGLSDELLHEFAEISANACRASLEGAPDRRLSSQEIRQAFEVLMAGMSEDDAERFKSSMGQGKELSYEDACWTVRIMYSTALDLTDADSALVARMLAIN